MNAHEPRLEPFSPFVSRPVPGTPAIDQQGDLRELERQVEFAVAECFFTVGQVVGMRTTLDWDGVVWARDHYRAKFLGAMKEFGNRWIEDRSNVTGVALMLGERLVRYAEGKPSIDLEAVRRAAADTERYCQLHNKRKARALGMTHSDEEPARIAGYWCNYEYGDEMP